MELYKIIYSEASNSFGLMTLKPEEADKYDSNVVGKNTPYMNFNAAKKVAMGDTFSLDKGITIIHRCKDCGKWFIMSSVEENWYREKGYPIPKRCKICRKKNKENGSSQNIV